MTMKWQGVMPAITTAFNEDLSIDHEFITRHCQWLVDNGCTGIVTPGSLGEGATLTFDEKLQLLQTVVKAVGSRVPVIAAVSALSTKEAVQMAKSAAEIGCKGLMVLPPYVYASGDWREMKSHLSEVINATSLSCMLYNNPIAYGTDFLPEQIQELSQTHANLHAVKESSTDVRRITGIRALIGDRLTILVGVDDAIVEGIDAGATGWIAGVVNALPRESVALFNAAMDGDKKKAFEIYKWMLPLLRMDTVPKFVQLIKLIQASVNWGHPRVRGPRLEIIGHELTETQAIIRQALEHRMKV